MKNTTRRISLLLVILMLATFCLASCQGLGNIGNNSSDNNQTNNEQNNNNQDNSNNPVIYYFELKAPKTNVSRGENITLNAVLKSAEAGETPVEDAEYIIVEGADYATISGNVLTVGNNAPDAAIIQVKARDGATESNVVTFIVRVNLAATSIVIEAIGSSSVVRGGTKGLIATVEPSAAASLVEWVITEGSNYATIKGTTLVVAPEAEVGATIKVKAYAGAVESNELVFTVSATQQEEDAAKYFISLNTNNIRLDKNGTSSPVLVAEVYNFNFEKVDGVDVEFTVIEGDEYLGVSKSGSTCSFAALGHGAAQVEVRVTGTNVTANAMVDVIVPPEAVVLPEVFTERPRFEYSFSLVDPITENAESLPFVPTVKGSELACTDLVFNFVHESGAIDDEVAVYENGAITFKKTGKVNVLVSSASGSRLEATASYTFNINNGYNVSTFDELQYVVESDFYIGQLPINVVVLEKPQGQTDYEYGYDLVPYVALLPHSEQTLRAAWHGYDAELEMKSDVRIQAVNKGVWINGNNHKIDASQLRIFTYEEYLDYADRYNSSINLDAPNHSSLFSAETWYSKGPSDPNFKKAAYSVKLYDLEVVGNVPIDYDPATYNPGNTGVVTGGFTDGISIGRVDYDTHYYIDVDNVTASAFLNGVKFSNVVGNGKASNIYVYNCYSTGIMARSSIVTLENLKLGICGATGIELGPEDSAKAGINSDEKCKITITGTVDVSANLNDGNTNYFQYYHVGGATVPQIITMNVANYAASQVAHARNKNGQFIFVSLLFNDMSTLAANQSIVEYPAYQAGGIIDMAELPTDDSVDTTHQFIKMTIYAPIPNVGTVPVGTAYFYNHNYQG